MDMVAKSGGKVKTDFLDITHLGRTSAMMEESSRRIFFVMKNETLWKLRPEHISGQGIKIWAIIPSPIVSLRRKQSLESDAGSSCL